MDRRTTISAIALISAAGLLVAGPLTPPAGPVVSSYKTLSEVEPRIAINAVNTPGNATAVYRIYSAGSYYLTGNVAGVAGKAAIEVMVTNVTIDLNGFMISGGSAGVRVAAPTSHLEVKNGVMTGISGPGVSGEGVSCLGLTVRNVRMGGVEKGVASDYGAVVESCEIAQSTYNAIEVSTGSIVRDCMVRDAGATGIYTEGACVVSGCAVNTAAAYGIRVANGSEVRECTVTGATTAGIAVATGGTAVDCAARSNGGHGFQALGRGALFSRCTSSNNDHGFSLGEDGTADRCVAEENRTNGFHSADGATITGCRARRNACHGILVGDDAVVSGSLCLFNGTSGNSFAGIMIAGNAGRFEDNHCNGNDYGIAISSGFTDNFVVRNTCSSNTVNFSYEVFNEVGPVIANPNFNNFGTAGAWANFGL